MVQPRVDDNASVRIAVVGAETRTGTLLRSGLAEAQVPGSRVNLYAALAGEAVISEYDGEARLIQDPDLPEIVAHEVVYLCEPGELTRQVIAAAGRDTTVVDLIGCLPDHVESRLVHPDINAGALAGQPGFLRVPDPLAMTLAELLHGLETSLGVDQALATVLRPASDYGQPGIEELREQTVRLLGFADVPTETFGAQLAFNVLREVAPSTDGPPAETRVREDIRRILDWDRQRIAVRCLTVPVFYGHGMQLHLTTRQPGTLGDIRLALATSSFFGPPVPAARATPLLVAADSATVVAEPVEDGLGGFWIWAVAGEAGARWATMAVRLSNLVCAPR